MLPDYHHPFGHDSPRNAGPSRPSYGPTGRDGDWRSNGQTDTWDGRGIRFVVS